MSRRGGRARTNQPPNLFDDISESQQNQMPFGNQAHSYYDPNAYSHEQQPPSQNNQPTFSQFPSAGFSHEQHTSMPQFMPNAMMNDMAMQYGQQMLGQGSTFVQENLHKYVNTSRVRYYFAVDNAYVGKKLMLLLFPYANKNWSLQYNTDEGSGSVPVAPRFDLNAPDLYIPTMAFLTYVLLAGVALGVNNKFSPEQLGMQTSTALVWLLIEILVLLLTLYIFNLNTRLRYLDMVAYAGYKYVEMILVVIAGLFFGSLGFYLTLIWCSLSLAFFLVRTLHFQIHSEDHSSVGTKRRHYLLIFVAAIQPILMWLLTGRLLS